MSSRLQNTVLGFWTESFLIRHGRCAADYAGLGGTQITIALLVAFCFVLPYPRRQRICSEHALPPVFFPHLPRSWTSNPRAAPFHVRAPHLTVTTD
ncbi:hypothetical protein BKA70DRAFT_1453930 [Coprinopsis sp. MPI-PUGE-AT-0042]|nr:hypothetical protein BKA70DRAFT_1453930 [Coprinopsis sp. MPI-PUGE-AT-0042]